MSPEEVAALIEVVEDRGESRSRDTALLAVLSHGLRASEAVGLNVGDYDGVRLTKACSTLRHSTRRLPWEPLILIATSSP